MKRTIQCEECSQWVVPIENACPECGESLDPEFVQYLEKRLPVRPIVFVATIIVAGLIFAGGYSSWFSATHYSWEQPIISTVSDKEHHDAWTQVYSYSCGSSEHPRTCIGTIHHPERWEIVLKDGHQETVGEGRYNDAFLGSNWTYSITRTDWKPGMEDSPIPGWVISLPATVGGGIIGVYYIVVILNRKKEFREWRETGDMEIGNPGD